MHYVYILRSLKDGKLYKGNTSDAAARLIRHNQGGNKSTAHRKPFVLLHSEEFETKTEALKRENFFKTHDGNLALQEI